MKKIYYILLIFSSLLFLYGCNKQKENIFSENYENKEISQNQETNDKESSLITIFKNKEKDDKEKNNIDEEKEDSIYTNKKEGFSIKIPAGRSVKENKNIGHVFLSSPLKEGDNINENIIINTDTQTGYKTVQEYYKVQKQGIQNHIKNYKEVLKEKIEISKSDGLKIIYKGELGNYKLQRQQIIFSKNGKFFLITYTSTQENFDSHIKDANYLIDSMKFDK